MITYVLCERYILIPTQQKSRIERSGDRTRTTLKETKIHDASTGNMRRQAPSNISTNAPAGACRHFEHPPVVIGSLSAPYSFKES